MEKQPMKLLIAATAALALLAGPAAAAMKPLALQTKAFNVAMTLDQPNVEILRYGALVVSAACFLHDAKFLNAQLIVHSTSGTWAKSSNAQAAIYQPNERQTWSAPVATGEIGRGSELFTFGGPGSTIWAEGGEVLLLDSFDAWTNDTGCTMTMTVTTFKRTTPSPF
jgi:hypothetical protein